MATNIKYLKENNLLEAHKHFMRLSEAYIPTVLPEEEIEEAGEDMQDPNAMGGDPNAMGGEDDELMNIINGLSIEDKAAVTKYAKSMADDSEGAEDPMMGGEMPMESKRGMKNIIDEVLNDVLDNKEGTKRPEKKMPRQYRDMEMPFKSPF